MAAPNGLYYRLDTSSGRFIFAGVDTQSPGDGTCCVSGAPDSNSAAVALNAGASVPTPLTGKWQVPYANLTNAIGLGARAALTPWSYYIVTCRLTGASNIPSFAACGASTRSFTRSNASV